VKLRANPLVLDEPLAGWGCDRINFLHSGEIVLDASTADTTEEELIRIVKSGLGREAIAAAAAEVQRQMSQS
jgi:hypothetical protein